VNNKLVDMDDSPSDPPPVRRGRSGSKACIVMKYTPLTSPLKEKAEKELGETEEVAVKCIEDLRKRIVSDGDFCCPLEEDFLLKFLRVRKFNVDDAYSNIQSFSKYHTRWPEILKPSNISDVMDRLFRSGINTILPDRDRDGGLVVLAQTEYWDASVVDFDDYLTSLTILQEVLLRESINQICGISIVTSYSGFGTDHVKLATPAAIHRCACILVGGLSFRLKGIHLCNLNPYVDTVVQLILKVLPEKMQKRFHFHSTGFDTLHEYFPKEMLPPEFGGNKDLDKDEFFNRVMEEEDSIKESFEKCYELK